jgi:hypothetical protein
MSVEMISLVLNNSRADGRAKLVLIGIANHHGDNGAWPSIATLARYANASERSIQRDIKHLQDLGELVVEVHGGESKGQYKSNKYWISISGVSEAQIRGDKLGSGVTDQVVRGDKLGKSGVTHLSYKPSIETYIETYTHFDNFWKVYPRRTSKRAAMKAFESAMGRASVDDILAGAIRFANDPNLPQCEFIPYPTTWLNGDRWEDGPLPERTKSKEELQNEARMAEKARLERIRESERIRKLEALEQEQKVNSAPPKDCAHGNIVWNCRQCSFGLAKKSG